MGLMDLITWQYAFLFGGAMFIFGLIALAFWIWMLIDCAKRRFRNNVEKVIWIIAFVFLGLLGALVYLIAVRMYNPSGLFKR
ncbi:MAG: PLDc N-terminal domain-containing protein [Nanoarchaeota archaeon]